MNWIRLSSAIACRGIGMKKSFAQEVAALVTRYYGKHQEAAYASRREFCRCAECLEFSRLFPADAAKLREVAERWG